MITLRQIWDSEKQVAVCMTYDESLNVIKLAVCATQKSERKENTVLVLRAETLRAEDFKRYDLQSPITEESLVDLGQGLFQDWMWSPAAQGGHPEGF